MRLDELLVEVSSSSSGVSSSTPSPKTSACWTGSSVCLRTYWVSGET